MISMAVRWSELMSAISLATDLGMAQPLESGLATCLVATALAARLGLDLPARQRTYHLSLLQHIGCTAASTNGNVDANLDGQTNDRAQQVGDPHIDNPTAAAWLNTAAFV